MSVTTSQRMNTDTFFAQFPGPVAATIAGAALEQAAEKTITVQGFTDQQIQQAVTAAAALFVDHDTRLAGFSANLTAALPTVRQWATDAATANTNWPTMTAAQKDATTRETIRRLGVFLDRFGDLITLMNGDR